MGQKCSVVKGAGPTHSVHKRTCPNVVGEITFAILECLFYCGGHMSLDLADIWHNGTTIEIKFTLTRMAWASLGKYSILY